MIELQPRDRIYLLSRRELTALAFSRSNGCPSLIGRRVIGLSIRKLETYAKQVRNRQRDSANQLSKVTTAASSHWL